MKPNRHVIRVWGEFACFTRPEMKVERLSYPIMTPSAARGILDAIYCRPSRFRWQVKRIEMLNPPRYISLSRNEFKEKGPSARTIKSWMQDPSKITPIYIQTSPGDKGHTLRQTVALKDVCYRIHAEIRPWPGFEKELRHFEHRFVQRAKAGKFFHHPYLGCREFPAFFKLYEWEEDEEKPADIDLELGLMVYDVFDLSKPGKPTDKPFISLFRASIRQGVMEVPDYDSPEVIKPIRSEEVSTEQIEELRDQLQLPLE